MRLPGSSCYDCSLHTTAASYERRQLSIRAQLAASYSRWPAAVLSCTGARPASHLQTLTSAVVQVQLDLGVNFLTGYEDDTGAVTYDMRQIRCAALDSKTSSREAEQLERLL